MDKLALTEEIKQLIIEECDKEDDITIEEFDSKSPLMGRNSILDLDSLDALQISMAVKKQYGVRIEGQKEARNALATVDSLASYIMEHKP